MHQAELVRDLDRPRAWTLLLGGFPQSHVDLDDPEYLEFEYVRRLGHVVDAAPPGPLRVLHLGAGALTLARYVAATRPGSDQLAIEHDAELVELVRERLPLPRARHGRIRVRVADARAALDGMRAGTFDVLVSDVFAAGQTPASLTSAEYAASAARALRPDGIFAANIADGPPLAHVRAQVATIGQAFRHMCLLADAGVLRGRRFGNVVVAASQRPLPVARLTRDVAADPMPGRVLDEQELTRFTAGARPASDGSAVPSPAPPASLFGRR
jgi:SAM-dependent methyltransferase